VWPEAALPPFPDPEAKGRLYLRLGRWSAEREADLLTGALSQSAPRAPFYHTAVFLHQGEPAQEYAKVHLTPLVEHLPFVGRSPALDAMTLPEEGGRLASGQSPVLFEGAGYRVAPVIGLESLHGDYVRQLVSDGADGV